MPKNIAVTAESTAGTAQGKERERIKELKALRDALDKTAYEALTANQRNELNRRVLLALVRDALRDERADIQAQKAK